MLGAGSVAEQSFTDLPRFPDLNARLAQAELPRRLQLIRAGVRGRLVFTTSFGLEDQVLTAAIAASGIEIEVATLDTGRLFPDVYDLWAATEARYGLRVRPFYPERESLESLVNSQGIEGFRASLEARKACCGTRKVEPLGRALQGAGGWLTGLRSSQSPHRAGLGFVVHDTDQGLVKASPLLDWSREQVVAFAEAHAVPVNPLHAQGYLSIGCAPCTRAVPPGGDERDGRWWWEEEGKKECGLHVHGGGRIMPGQPQASSAPTECGS
jgi:phosphoadenosine phosphosulfate reductase